MNRKAAFFVLTLVFVTSFTWPDWVLSATVPYTNPEKGLVIFYRPKKFSGGAIRFSINHAEGSLGVLNNGTMVCHVVGLGPWFPRASAALIMLVFIGLNLRGVGETGTFEIFLVWFKLAVLVGLATWGLLQWNPAMLSQGVEETGIHLTIFGAAAIFMAYEGFQLLSYDFEDIEKPEVTLPRAVLSAIVVVTIVYMLVAIGKAMLIGADQVVAHKEVALAVAGQKAMGTAGLVLVAIFGRPLVLRHVDTNPPD